MQEQMLRFPSLRSGQALSMTSFFRDFKRKETMKKNRLYAAIILLMLGIACAPKKIPILNADSTAMPADTPVPEDKYGHMLTPVTEEEAAVFLGTWKGSISGFDFRIHVVAEGDLVSATLDIEGGTETLFVLGANETTLYFFRDRDNACLSMYWEGNKMKLEYYEQGAPRIISLSRVD